MFFLVLILYSVIIVVAIAGGIIFGIILERRYMGPYTLLATTRHQQWTRAIILSFWQTLPVPILGLYFAQFSPVAIDGNPFPFAPILLFCCWGSWIAIFPLFVLIKHWGFTRQKEFYRQTDEQIKKGGDDYQRFRATYLERWTKWFLTSEQKRFFREGFLEIVEREGNDKMS